MMPTWSAGAYQLVFGVVLALCTASLVLEIRRGDRRVAVAEANHVAMAVAMVVMVVPAVAPAVPPLAGAALFGALAAAWVGRLFVLLIRGERLPSPITRADCTASPLHLTVANVATMGMYAVGSAGFLDGTTMPGAAAHASMPGMAMDPTADTPTAFVVGAVALAVYLFAHGGMIAADLATSTRTAPAAVAVATTSGSGTTAVTTATTPTTTTGPRRPSDLRVRQACQGLMSFTMGWMLLGMI